MRCNRRLLRDSVGASGKSWAWLNANHKQPAHYRGMVTASDDLIHTAARQYDWQIVVYCPMSTIRQLL